MIRDTAAMLAYEAGRRPALAAMLARIGSVADTEIEQSGFAKWIRLALHGRRDSALNQTHTAQLASRLADHIVDGRTGDPLGDLRRWTGGAHFVRVERGSAIEVQPDQRLWLPVSGGLWIETVFTRFVDPCVLANTCSLGTVRKSGYIAAYKAEAARLLPADVPVLASGRSSPLAAYGVRFG